MMKSQFQSKLPPYVPAKRPFRRGVSQPVCVFAWSVAYTVSILIVVFLLAMSTWSRAPIKTSQPLLRLAQAAQPVAVSADESLIIYKSAFPDTSRGGRAGEVPEFYASEDFQYPLLVDMPGLLARLRSGRSPQPGVRPINEVRARWLLRPAGACAEPRFLILLVKSHPDNRPNRDAIRATWGNVGCWRSPVRLFFLLGVGSNSSGSGGGIGSDLQAEYAAHGDLLVRDFFDHYYSNTAKLMSGVEWATESCRDAKFVAFVDDDFVLSPRSVERYLTAAASSPAYARFIGGWVWRSAAPHRSKGRSQSKWDVSTSEYPWSTYPPYVAAGAMFISGPVLSDISVAMRFTRHLRFDDIFVGLVLHKLGLTPIHMNYVRSDAQVALNGAQVGLLRKIIAAHGYRIPDQLRQLWPRLAQVTGLNCSTATTRNAAVGKTFPAPSRG